MGQREGVGGALMPSCMTWSLTIGQSLSDVGPIGAPPISREKDIYVFFNWKSWPMWLSLIGHISSDKNLDTIFLPSDNLSDLEVTKPIRIS